MQAIPGSAAQLTALTFRPPHGSSKGKLDWSQFGDSLSQLSSLSVSSDYRHAGPATSLSALTGELR